MVTLVGAILLSQDLSLHKHINGLKKCINNPTCIVYSMVHFNILNGYCQPGLRAAALLTIEIIMGRDTYGVNFLFWCDVHNNSTKNLPF